MNLCPLHVDICFLQNIRMKGVGVFIQECNWLLFYLLKFDGFGFLGIQILSRICLLFSTLLYGGGHDICEMYKAGEDVISKCFTFLD